MFIKGSETWQCSIMPVDDLRAYSGQENVAQPVKWIVLLCQSRIIQGTDTDRPSNLDGGDRILEFKLCTETLENRSTDFNQVLRLQEIVLSFQFEMLTKMTKMAKTSSL